MSKETEEWRDIKGYEGLYQGVVMVASVGKTNGLM